MNDHQKSNVYLERIASMLQNTAPNRFSATLVNQIAYMPYAGMNEPYQFIILEIEYLENLTKITKTKDAKPFERPKMKGLWGKHFYLPQFVAKNCSNYWKRHVKNTRSFNDHFDQYVKMYEQNPTEENARIISEKMAHDFINIPQAGFNSGDYAKTGEYIIFKEHLGEKYYLCLGIHRSDDEILQYVEKAYDSFPFLRNT
jgi:hypothetical protein